MSRLRINLLGPPRVELDGQPVHFGRRRALALLAYVAVTQRTHARDSLATLLWPELDQSTARARLRRVLATLREGLGDGWVEAGRERVGLHPDADLWLDVDAFRWQLAARGDHDHPAADVCPVCVRMHEEAARLYQDDFLAGFTLRDSPAFDEWQFFESEHLRDDLARALERLSRWHSSRGAHEVAIGHAQRRVALDPLHEPAQRALMEMYAHAGRQADALRQYRECARVLETELGLPPSAGTVALYEQIRAGLAERVEPASAPARPRVNLPAQPIPLVGRERELAEIGQCLYDPNCRLLTLVGPGGSGKTRLAVEAAASRLGEFEDGVFFVSLAGLDSPESIAPTIGQAIGFPFRGEGDLEDQLLAYLGRRRMLLVLDNYEHLLARTARQRVDGAGIVVRMVDAAPGVKALVTSRASLRVQDERLYPVGGLEYPELESDSRYAGVGGLPTEFSAMELFVQSARRVAPHFRLEPDSMPDVVRICQLTSGMPLGILLAASWVRVLTPAEIAAQLATGLDLLETDLRDVPARQRSMRAVFDHSWSLLTAGEQAVMEVLSVFRGGFTRDAARRVVGASAGDLRSLIGRSLVQPSRTSPTGPGTGRRFELHELLRQYAAERLAESPAASLAARDRHAAYYAAALEVWGEELKGPRQRETLLEMDLEIGNARAAWDWAAERRHSEHLSRAAFGLSQYYERKARVHEAEGAFREAAERLRAAVAEEAGATTPETLRALAKMLRLQGHFTSHLGRREAARELLHESLDLLRRPELAGQDTRLEEACIWLVLGEVQRATGRGDFRRSFERALALARSTGDQWQVAATLDLLADCDNYDGEFRAARVAAEERLAIARALGDLRGIGCATCFLGWVLARMGEVARGVELTREAVRLLEDLGDPVRLSDAHLLLAATLAYAGRYAESCALLEEVLADLIELGVGDLETNVVGSLGWVEVSLGEYERARDHLETGLRRARDTNYLYAAAGCWGHLARIALVEGNYAKAERLIREAIAAWERIACQEFVFLGRCLLAIVLERVGDPLEAGRSMAEALRWTAAHESYHALVEAISSAALLLLDKGKTEEAIEVFELARTFPYVANSRWHEDVVGQPIAQAAASLPPDVVDAARERGRARDVQATLEELLAEWG